MSAPDTTDRHLGDLKLRHHGFEIHARPRKGPAMWKRRQAKNPKGFSYFTEADAHALRKAEIERAVSNASKR